MTKENYSVQLFDSKKCAIIRTIDVGLKGGLQLKTCIPKSASSVLTKGLRNPTRHEWRRYGKKQSYLISKDNVGSCELFDVDPPKQVSSLCAKNKRGERELRSLRTMNCSRKKGRKQICNSIEKIPNAEPELYRLVSI